MDGIFSTLSAIALSVAGQTQVHLVVATGTVSGERFIGSAESRIQGGSFELISEAGVVCTGLYDVKFVSDRQTIVHTRGGVQCDDGRSGAWVTAGSLDGGQGTAEIGSEMFEIRFGDLAND